MLFKYKDISISKKIGSNRNVIKSHALSIIRSININNGIRNYDIIDENLIEIIPESLEESNIMDETGVAVFNVKSVDNPTNSSNILTNDPDTILTWLNIVSGEIFVCLDNTIDNNTWIGQMGTNIKVDGAVTLNDQCAFHFCMDELKGNTLHDGSNKFSANMKNVKIAKGIINNCLSFTGNSYGKIEPEAQTRFTETLTISLWLYPRNQWYRQNPLWKNYHSEFAITQERDGTISFYFGNGRIYNSTNSINKINFNQWNHVSICRKQDKTVEIYLDGVLSIVETNGKIIESIAESSNPIHIGSGYAGGYDGLIDDLYVHTRELTDNERSYLVNKKILGL